MLSKHVDQDPPAPQRPPTGLSEWVGNVNKLRGYSKLYILGTQKGTFWVVALKVNTKGGGGGAASVALLLVLRISMNYGCYCQQQSGGGPKQRSVGC